jgi:hypothetical protein
VTKDLKKGDVLSEENVRVIRPGYGEKPKYIDDILGMQVTSDVAYGMPFTFDLLGEGSVMLLTNDVQKEEFSREIRANGERVLAFSNKITLDMVQKLKPERMVVCNYKHAIPIEVEEYLKGRILYLLR